MTPFRRGFRITQKFNANPSYYSQFGLKGHEGLDLVPTDEKGNVLGFVAGTDNWDVLAVEGGTVVRDDENLRDGINDAYGNHVVILAPTGRAWWYCHLTTNFVAIGQKVKRGDRLGHMGTTGNSSGAHLHLGLRLADANGSAINLNNGYKGFVDPLEPLNSFNANSPYPPLNPPPTPTPPAPQPIPTPLPDNSAKIAEIKSLADKIKAIAETIK